MCVWLGLLGAGVGRSRSGYVLVGASRRWEASCMLGILVALQCLLTIAHRPRLPSPSQGGYRACNRIGINACTSPFLKISFETAASFLVSATLHGDVDALTSPAARIVLGRTVGVGTGCLELVQNMEARPAQLAC